MEATDLPILPKGLHRSPEEWAKVIPDAFLTGSIQQARNVIEMMQQDIAKLAQGFDHKHPAYRAGEEAYLARGRK